MANIKDEPDFEDEPLKTLSTQQIETIIATALSQAINAKFECSIGRIEYVKNGALISLSLNQDHEEVRKRDLQQVLKLVEANKAKGL